MTRTTIHVDLNFKSFIYICKLGVLNPSQVVNLLRLLLKLVQLKIFNKVLWDTQGFTININKT